jgi:FtsH-binding integral membrane protein
MDERPPALWGSFPLTELLALVGIVLMGWGLATWNSGGHVRFGAGIAIAALGGLELSVREHLGGFRSHTTLLSGAVAFVVVSVLALGPGPHVLGALVIIGAVVFAVSFYLLRELFKRRSGGLGWR